MQKIRYALLGLCVLLCCSCSGRIDGVLRERGSAELSLELSLQPRMAALITALAAFSGSDASAGGPLIDGPAVARSLAAAPGGVSAELRNTSPSAVAGTIRIAQCKDFLAIPEQQTGTPFMQYDPAGRAVISLDRQSGPRLMALISPEAGDYLSALMAPLVTGEALTKEEYLALIRSVYRQAMLADEIAASQVLVTLTFPRPIKAIRGGTFQGTKAQFSIPVVDFLVLERPLVYEVTW